MHSQFKTIVLKSLVLKSESNSRLEYDEEMSDLSEFIENIELVATIDNK